MPAEATPRGQTRTALVSVGAACVLVVLKLGTGLATGGLALVSAGIESSGDVIAAVFTLLAIRIGGRPADEDHPYGHRRAENLAALGEAVILIGGAVFVVVKAVGALTGGGEPFEPHWYVFAVIALALAIDVSRVLVSLRSAARYRSAALRSNAFHFAGDMTGSLAVLAGIVAVAAGFEQGDAVASLLVAAVIFSAAGRLIYENARVLMDTTPPEARPKPKRPSPGSRSRSSFAGCGCASPAATTSPTRRSPPPRSRRWSRATRSPTPSSRRSGGRSRTPT